jgi:hypothetical protein
MPEVPVETFHDLWKIKYGDNWVQDHGYGEKCISDPFYLAAATALHKAGLLERTWIVGTDYYAYRLRNGNP